MANNTPPRLPDEALTEMQRYVTQLRGTEPLYSGNLLEICGQDSTIVWFAMRGYSIPKRNTSRRWLAEFL